MINIKKSVFILLIIILLSYSVSAGLGLNLRKTSYGPNQHLDGTLNFSFGGNLNADTPVIVSVNGLDFETTLEDFLGVAATDESYIKSGTPVSTAMIDFSEAGSNTSYGIDLTQNGQITPDLINKLIFNVSGSGSPSPMLPSIKLGDVLVWSYRGPIVLPEQYINPGIPYLYSFESDGVENIKPKQAFCEKINIKAAPKYKIVANVKKVKDGYDLLAFIIDDIESENIPISCGSNQLCCTFDGITNSFANRKCTINNGVNADGEKYLCIITGSGTGSATDTYYGISKEIKDDKFVGYFVDESGDVSPLPNTDYFIWYEYARFETNLSGKVNLSDFTSLVDEYPAKGDVIPITVMSKGKGSINLIELFTDIKRTEGPSSEYTKFAPIKYSAPKVSYPSAKTQSLSSGFLTDFVTPLDVGTYTLTISVGSESKSATINVINEPIAIITYKPEFPGVSQDITFNGSESFSPEGLNITGYKWDFGNGKIGNGSIAKTSYNKTRDYTVKLTVTDQSGISGVYETIVSVRSILGDLGVALNATELTINSIKNFIAGSNDEIKDSAELLGINQELENATTQLSLLKISYNGALNLSDATRESELARISNNLFMLMDSTPRSLKVTSFKSDSAGVVSLSELPDLSKLNIEGVTDLESFKFGLLEYQEGISIKGDARLVEINYITDKKDSFILVKKNIDTTKVLKGKIYEISNNVKTVLTDGYEAVVPNSIYRWPVDKREIVYIVEGVDVSLAAESRTIVIPPLSEFGEASLGEDIFGYEFDCGNKVCDAGEDEISCPQDCRKKYPLGFIVFLIVLAITGAYYLNFYHGPFSFGRFFSDLKGVFKKKEKLFKNEQDLTNLKNYIKNAITKGITKSQIIQILRQKKWTAEQIEEAFKQAKVKGK